ncbi:MAG: hypothetical protein GX106_04395 [Candidatus Cloacimonetes bacterium]|nr:hypothetical protein [Candidatus Cloacimonadota bacterium]
MFQLSFLNAGLLIFASATIIPLLIWLFAKKKPPKVIFPSLRFIKISHEQERSRSKFSSILLLIIRMLIILFVVLSLARPLLNSTLLKKSKKHAPAAVAVILDNSYSMDASTGLKTRLERAKEVLTVINERANADDRLIFLSRDMDFNRLNSQIHVGEIPSELFEKHPLSLQAANWQELIDYAQSRLSQTRMPNREIYIISDLVEPRMEFKSEIPVSIIEIDPEKSAQNLSISRAMPEPRILDRSKHQSISFRLNNHGDRDMDEVLVQAVVDDIKLAEKFLSVKARESLSETIEFELRHEGWQAGYIEVLDENLEADNRSYFAFEYEEFPRIAVISNSTLPAHLANIIKIFGGGKAATTISPQSLNRQLIDDYKLFVFYDFGEVSPRLRDFLARLDEEDKGSLFCLGSKLSAEQKSFLSSRFDTRIGELNQSGSRLDFILNSHPSGALIADKELKFNEITAFWQTEGKGAQTLGSRGYPLALEKDNSALWLWDAAAFSPFFSDPAYVVFAYSQMRLLSSGVRSGALFELGDSIRSSAMILPSLEAITLADRSFTLNQPGIYTLNPQNADAAKIAVNIQLNDSDPFLAELPKKARKLSEDYASELFINRFGRELSRLLLLIALALLALEIALVKILEKGSQQRRSS